MVIWLIGPILNKAYKENISNNLNHQLKASNKKIKELGLEFRSMKGFKSISINDW